MQPIQTTNAPAAIGPYSQAIAIPQIGGLLFCSGQIPIDPSTGELVTTGIEEQTVQVLENLRAVLEAGGSSLKEVVKVTIFLTDLANFAAVNTLYSRYFSDPYPARSTIQISALPKGASVEIEAIALISKA